MNEYRANSTRRESYPVINRNENSQQVVGGQHLRVAQPVAGSGSPSAPTPIFQDQGNPVVRVVINPALKIAPPPHLIPLAPESSRVNFEMNFDMEKRIIAEAKKYGLEPDENTDPDFPPQNANPPEPSRPSPPQPRPAQAVPVEDSMAKKKYVGLGLKKHVIDRALQIYGDNEPKVIEFCSSFSQLEEMGFDPDDISKALAKSGNDHQKAVGILLQERSEDYEWSRPPP